MKRLMRLLPGILFLLLYNVPIQTTNVGLLVVATGKYIQFVKPLIESAKKYFCVNANVTYFIFTEGEVPQEKNIIKIEQNRLGWPYDTLMRCAMYDKVASLFDQMDYLFACDADMRFVDFVGDEILADRVATIHPGFVNKRGTYETRCESCARVKSNEGDY
jgi:histo-blood group ABO system transferase